MRSFTRLAAVAGLLALAYSLTAAEAATPTVTLTVSPASGPGSVTPTLTWSSTGAVSCVASGGWSGAQAVSGSVTLPAVTANTTFSLTCASATGPAHLKWVDPTQNTDGTTLTDLAGYHVYVGSSATSLAVNQTVTDPAATTLDMALPPGLTFFALTAFDSAGNESAQTNVLSDTIVADSAITSASVAVSAVPNPPTGFQVN